MKRPSVGIGAAPQSGSDGPSVGFGAAERGSFRDMSRHKNDAQSPMRDPDGKSKLSGKTVGVIIVSLLAVLFIVLNTQTVEIRFWIPTLSVPLWTALALAAVLGAAIGFMSGRSRYRSKG